MIFGAGRYKRIKTFDIYGVPTLPSILENSQSPVLKIAANGTIVSANGAALRLFGYGQDGVVGKPARILFSDSDNPNEPFGSLRRLLGKIALANTAETVGLRGDDTEIPVEVVLIPSDDGFVCQVRDISRNRLSSAMDAVLHATLRRVMRGQTYEQFCPYICEKIVDLLGCPLAWIGKKEKDGSVTVCAAAGTLAKGFPAHPIRWDDLSEQFGPTGQAIRTKRTKIIELADDKIVDSDGRAHIRQILVFPLITHDGIEGVLEIHSKTGKLDSATVQRLETFSLRIAMAMQMAANQQTLRLQGAALETSPNAFVLTDKSGTVLWVNPAFCRLSGYTESEVVGQPLALLETDAQNAAFYTEMWNTLNAGNNWCAEITERKKSGALYTVEQRITPIMGQDGKLAYCVFVRNDVTARKDAEGLIMHLANYDQLTGLPNRSLFYEQLRPILKRAAAQEQKVALIFADLTNFNRINDTLGHAAGDELLKIVAQRLSKLGTNKDFVARIGGDEFTVIVEGVKNAEAAAIRARTMIESILEPVFIENTEVNVGANIGISIFPDDGTEADKLVNFADMALRTASHSAPNSYFFFSQEMNEETEDNLALERDLRKGLIQNEFALFFQPQYDVKTGKILSAEALIRWFHPTRGMVSPVRFIPIAEDTGLIIPLGDWILREALRYIKLWDDMGLPKISVAVNLSAIQFQQEDLAGSIEKILNESGVSPDRLELELTESVVMQDARKADNILSRLSRIGIKLAIDDFGTGYSSLSYLKRFDVDRLKIDQSFVRDMTNNYDDAEIARAIINLGHTLGLEIVSEGVETKEQLELLKQQGCDVIQGYLISRPIPAAEIPAFLKKEKFYE